MIISGSILISRNTSGVLYFCCQFYHLFLFVSDLIFAERDCCRDEAELMLNKILAMESTPLFTQNVQFLEERERHWHSRYMNQISPYNNSVYGATSLDFPSQAPESSSLTLFHTFPKFPYDPAIDGSEKTWSDDDEVKVMANVQAYFEVAHKVSVLLSLSGPDCMLSIQRITDNVPLVIEHELNQNFAAKIHNKLIDTIFKDSQSGQVNLEDLLKEDLSIALKRETLEDKISRLSKIKAKLDQFWGDRAPDDLSVEQLQVDHPTSEISVLPSVPYRGNKKKKRVKQVVSVE